MKRDVESSAMTQPKGKKPTKPAKVVDHIRIHPQMGGGVTVAHHYTSIEHEPAVHNFGMTDGSGFHKHIASVTGMPMDAEGETATPEEEGE